MRVLLPVLLQVVLIVAFWRWMGTPVVMPAAPLGPGDKLYCLSYAPFHGDQTPLDPTTRIDPAQMDEMTPNADVELGEQLPADRRRSHPRRRLARRRALENVASVVTIVLENPGEIRVSRPHASHSAPARRRIRVTRRGIHDLLPVLPVAIVDEHRYR